MLITYIYIKNNLIKHIYDPYKMKAYNCKFILYIVTNLQKNIILIFFFLTSLTFLGDFFFYFMYYVYVVVIGWENGVLYTPSTKKEWQRERERNEEG